METTIISKNLGRLGLVAGMIDELGIVATIDSAIVQDTRDRHNTVGDTAKAMIINDLDFSQRKKDRLADYPFVVLSRRI